MNKKLIASLIAVTMATTAGISFANGNGERRGAGNENGQEHSQMDRRGGGMFGGVNLEYIFTQMSLSEETQASVTATLDTFAESQREQMEARREQMRADNATRPTAEERMAQQEAFKAEAIIALTDQLNMVISPDQTDELVVYLDAHSSKGMDRNGPKKP